MASPAEALSRGFLDAIFTDKDKAEALFPVPVMQCLQIKPMAQSAAQGGERYRLVMSDGDNYVQAVLAAAANAAVRDDILKRGSLVRIHGYTTNTTNNKHIILILTLDVITQFGEVEKIGEPSPLNKIAPEATTISGNDFYGAKKETSAAPQSMPSRPAPSNNTAMGNIHPIEGLSPYSHKWTIKARVTSKSDIKRWHKASSEGRLFSVNLLDESGEIKATGFNDQCDMFFDLLQEGSVYYISAPCRVQIAKKQFSNLSHDYEMTFENGTSIVKAEDQSSVPQMRFNFCNIQDLQNVEKDNTVDIIGVLKEVGEESQITSKKTGQPFSKRDLTIVDDTGYSVRVTVWGAMASSFEAPTESVLAFKGTKVSDFNGKSLSLLSSGTMSVDPDISDAHRLKGWYDSTGRTDSFATHQNTSAMGTAGGRKDDFKTIAQVKEENIGVDDQQYYSIKATIVFIRNENFAYPACPREECKNKKVISMGDGTWRCESCDSTHDRAEYRYIMSINVADHTNHQWLSCFDETGRTIMGMSATELTEIQQTDDARFKSIFESVNCQTLKFRCRAKMDTYGGAQKMRYQVFSATPVDYTSESKRLLDLIKQYD